MTGRATPGPVGQVGQVDGSVWAEPSEYSERAREIADAARTLLEAEGADVLTMRRLSADLGIRAPSLYKHFPSKRHVEAALVEQAFSEMGAALHRAAARPGRRGPVVAVLARYRQLALSSPHLYRLATGPGLPRDLLPPGLEEWAGQPFYLVTGDAHLAQAMWAFAHGMAILEIEGRFPEGADLDRTWRAAAGAFAAQRSH